MCLLHGSQRCARPGRRAARAALALLVALLPACADRDAAAPAGADEHATENEDRVGGPASGYPLRVDWFGEPFEVLRRPQRVVPANASAVDFVVALLEPARVAALPQQAFDYASVPDTDAGAEWSALPQFYAFTAETLLEYRPDLVIADPWQAPDTVARLHEAGVMVLRIPEISDWADARAALVALAEVFQVDARGLLAELDERVVRLGAAAEQRAPVRALAYSNFGSAGWTAGSRTTLHAQMELAGVANVVAEAGRTGHLSITFEELLGYDPDCILVSQPLRTPASHAGDRGGASAALLTSEPALAGLHAVREDRIIALPAWFYAAGSHRMVAGAEELAREMDALLAREAAPDR